MKHIESILDVYESSARAEVPAAFQFELGQNGAPLRVVSSKPLLGTSAV